MLERGGQDVRSVVARMLTHGNRDGARALSVTKKRNVMRKTNNNNGGRNRRIKGDKGDNARVADASREVERVRVVSKGVLRNSRTSSRQAPIRLRNRHCPGLDPQEALSLDAPLDAEDGNATLLEMIAGPETEEFTINWPEALKGAKLTRLERRALERALSGTAGHRLPEALRVKPKAAKKALRDAISKVSRTAKQHLSLSPVPQSRRPIFREHLASAPGHRPYTFAPIVLDPIFQKTMAIETYKHLVYEEHPAVVRKRSTTLWTCCRGGFMVTVEELIEGEMVAVAPLRRWHSQEYCDDLARDRARNRIQLMREQAEQQRIESLTDSQVTAELEKTDNELRQTRLQCVVAGQKLEKASKTHKETRSTAKRELADFIEKGIPKLHAECDRLESEVRVLTWRLRLLGEQKDARDRVVMRRNVDSVFKETRSTVAACIKALEKSLEPFTSNLGAVCAEDIADAKLIQYALSVMNRVSGRMDKR